MILISGNWGLWFGCYVSRLHALRLALDIPLPFQVMILRNIQSLDFLVVIHGFRILLVMRKAIGDTVGNILELAALSCTVSLLLSFSLLSRVLVVRLDVSSDPFWRQGAVQSQRAGRSDGIGTDLAPDILGMIVHSPVYAPTASSAQLAASSDPLRRE